MKPDTAPRTSNELLAELENALTDVADRAVVDQPEPSTAHLHDILTTAEGSNRLGVFVDYMRAAGLSPLLMGDGPFTVFAPTDRAFAKMSLRERDALLADFRRLREVMRGHVVAARISPPTTATPVNALTVDGKTLVLTSNDGTYRVENVRLVQTSIPASNGIIHAIDSVLMPA
jgi:uncharacterized surface protein with fasciclin (FAS1) repeats